jgi:hypothetical protein
MDISNPKLLAAVVIGSLSFVAACTDNEDPASAADEATASTEQDVSWTSTTWHACSSLSCSWSLGDPATTTCFLAGLTGKLSAGSASYPAGANVVNNGTYWGLYILNPNYENIGVMTTCITATANRVSAGWYGGAATQINNATATRRCFLAGIYNYNYKAFSTFDTNVQVWRDGAVHFIGGTLPSGSSVSVAATCVDVPTQDGSGWAYGNGTANTVVGNISYNSAPGGTACGLTGLGGQFLTADPNKGVWIGYDSSTRYWNWTLTPWTGAYANCVR